ncbi:MAG: cytochrome c oxidase subunit II transmembrane domain-containing protein [Candidatus Thermoplasmatota archaeon]
MRPSVVALVATAVLLLVAAPAAARFGMPEPLTDRGKTVEDIYFQIALAGVLVFVLVFALLVWVLVRYREGGHGRSTHEKHRGSLKAELVWTIIPLAIMLWIGVMSYAGLVKLDAGLGSDDYAMEVNITGFQWFWQMDYGEGVVVNVIPTANAQTGAMSYSDTFHLPADTPILLNLTGNEVIHAFNILDANRAYVTMDDANPSGPHKYHTQVVSFPAGKYTIQCKEMCLNPGHGYMRAELVVDAPADFDEWKADRALFGSAALRELVDVTANNGKLTYNDPAPAVVVDGTRVGIKVTNAGTQAVEFTADGNTTAVAPGEVARVAFDAQGGKTYTVTFSPGGSFQLEAVTPDAEITVDLGDFFIRNADIQLQVGKGYLIRATNIGTIGHNLFIGTFGGEVLAESNTAGSGDVALVYFKPTSAATLDWWCNVPGHHGLGMSGTVTITA